MRVLATTHILDADVACEPGDILDLRDEIALDLLQRDLVLPIKDQIETPEDDLPEGETEMITRGRGRPKKLPVE